MLNIFFIFILSLYIAEVVCYDSEYVEHPILEPIDSDGNLYSEETPGTTTKSVTVDSYEYDISFNPPNVSSLTLDNIDQYYEQYHQYLNLFGLTEKEKEKFLETFAENVKRVITMNSITNGATFGINEFTRLTLEEFTDRYTGFDANELDDSGVQLYVKTKDPPIKIDWTPVDGGVQKHQDGECNISYVFSAMSTLEYQANKVMPMGHLILSAQQGFNCDPRGTCKSGGLPHDVLHGLKNVGSIMPASYASQFFIEPVMNKGPCTTHDPNFIRVFNITRLKVQSEEDLAAAVAEYGVFTTAIYVSQTVKNYHSGVLEPFDCDRDPNAAVIIVGYGTTDDNIPYWLLRFSWGIGWGELGHMRLIRGKGACGIGGYLVTAEVDLLLPGQIKQYYKKNKYSRKNRGSHKSRIKSKQKVFSTPTISSNASKKKFGKNTTNEKGPTKIVTNITNNNNNSEHNSLKSSSRDKPHTENKKNKRMNSNTTR